MHLDLRGWALCTSHCDPRNEVRWGILQLHVGIAPHFPSLTTWAQSRQCPNFRLHSLFSLMILFSVLLSRDEEKWDNCANEASFFISIVLLWCFIVMCQLFKTPESCLLEHKLFQSYYIKMVCFLLLGNRGGCVVVRGGSSLGRWEVKDCSDFKAMSLCKTPVKIWEKTELEERWPFHPCYMDWESATGLASCFKVMSKLSAYSFGPWSSPFFFFLSFLSQGLVHSICIASIHCLSPVFIFQIILNLFK